MKYIKELKDTYPADFFGLANGRLPDEGMVYFVERRVFNISFLPIKDYEVYMYRQGQWIRGKRKSPEKKAQDDAHPHTADDIRYSKVIDKLRDI